MTLRHISNPSLLHLHVTSPDVWIDVFFDARRGLWCLRFPQYVTNAPAVKSHTIALLLANDIDTIYLFVSICSCQQIEPFEDQRVDSLCYFAEPSSARIEKSCCLLQVLLKILMSLCLSSKLKSVGFVSSNIQLC
jgi:hypothetical protein